MFPGKIFKNKNNLFFSKYMLKEGGTVDHFLIIAIIMFQIIIC